MASASGDVIELKPADWSSSGGERWARHLDAYETMLAQAGQGLLDHADLVPGLSVAEIGCGGGAVSREIAARVAPGGRVVGIDISPALIALCEARAADAGVANASYIGADAATVAPEGAPFDRLMSRFGIMFFRDPPAAFANLRGLLRGGGRADFAVWGPPPENPAVSSLPMVARSHLNLPPVDPRAPGPFALCDPEYFRDLLEGAGFADVRMDMWRGNVRLGGGVGPAGAARFAMSSSMMADVLAEQPEPVVDAIAADLEKLLARYDGADGVSIPSAVWLVTATAP